MFGNPQFPTDYDRFYLMWSFRPVDANKIDFGFDKTRRRAEASKVERKTSHNRKLSGPQQADLMARGSGQEQLTAEWPAAEQEVQHERE